MKLLFLFIYGIFGSLVVSAQVVDSLPRADTIPVKTEPDTVRKVIRRPAPKRILPSPVVIKTDSIPAVLTPRNPVKEFQQAVSSHPYFNFSGKPLHITVQDKKRQGNEPKFYALLGLLLYFSMIKLLFGKYLNNLLTLFFRVTMRQQQLRDQLLGAPLPSLLLNFLFVINMGIYLAFIAGSFGFLPDMNFWTKAGYGLLLVSCIYLVKFVVLRITGWIFNASGATDTYIFVVFLVNKMIGIFLLPLIVVMAFASPVVLSILLVFSWLMIGAILVYRFIIAFRPIRSEINVNRFHFFLYLCAFEVAPLLLIYKVLLKFVERSN